MRQRCQYRARDHKQVQQLELFTKPMPIVGDTAPTWQVLPEETRQVLTGLMARLLLDHRGLEPGVADDV